MKGVSIFSSPNTTWLGISAAVTSLGGLIGLFAQGGPVDWAIAGPLVASFFSGILSALGNIASRDNGVSSQDVGIRPVPKPAPLVADAIQRSQQQ